jgi:hypothetical protein
MIRQRASTFVSEALKTTSIATGPSRRAIGQALRSAPLASASVRLSIKAGWRSTTVALAPAVRRALDAATRLVSDPARAFDVLYTVAISDSNPMYSAQRLAKTTTRESDERLESALVRLTIVQTLAAGAGGAALSIGNLVTMPLAALFSMYVKVVSVAAVAQLAGHDLRDAATKAKICAVVIGETAAAAEYRTIAIDASKIAVEQLAKVFCRQAVTIARLGRMAPLVGAGVSGTLEMMSIRSVTRNAIAEFCAFDKSRQRGVRPTDRENTQPRTT